MNFRASIFWFLVPLLAFGCGVDSPSEREPAAPEQCRSQCELAAGSCEEIPLEDFPSFEATRSAWASSCDQYLFVIAGVCEDGSQVLRSGNGHTSELRIFDSDGSVRGLLTTTDYVDSVCMGQSYWPSVVACKAPVTTDVLCGTSFKTGDPAIEKHWGG